MSVDALQDVLGGKGIGPLVNVEVLAKPGRSLSPECQQQGQVAGRRVLPDGSRPEGPSSLPATITNGVGPNATQAYRPRALTNGGRRLFFDSRDALVSQDTNNDTDAYEWEAQGTGSCTESGGCLNLISSGRSEDGAVFADASADGRDAFFLTGESLVEADPGAVDLYDARAGGGFAVAPKPIPCDGDACQPLPSPPDDPRPGTTVPTEGNPPLRFKKARKPGKGKRHHKGKKKHKGKGKKQKQGKRHKGSKR